MRQAAAAHRRGTGRRRACAGIRNLSGKRTDGAKRMIRFALLFRFAGDRRAEAHPAQRRPPRRRRAHGRLRRLGHAGQLRLADRRAPRGAARRRACSTCRTCASSTSQARGARDFLRYALANNVDKLKEPGKALYSCLLRRGRRRARRPHRLFPARGLLPARRQRGDRRQGHRVAARGCSRRARAAACARRRATTSR